MSIWRLVIREIVHRRLNFVLAMIAVCVAVACLVGVLVRLAWHDAATVAILDDYRQQVEVSSATLEDDMRKITKGLGFNVLITPRDQNLSDVFADDYAGRTMPEEYVTRLANAPIVTVDHLLPILERSVQWPEAGRRVILIGVRGQVPLVFAEKQKKPLMQPVEQGHMIVGHGLAEQMNLSVGDAVEFQGRSFTVSEVYEYRGSKDDMTLWIPLATAQELLNQTGRINAIWALNCNCASVDMIGGVRDEIAALLPDTDVRMLDHASVRAEARVKASQKAEADLIAAANQRGELRGQIESFAAVLTPAVVLAAGIWIGLLTLGNVRDRRSEIAVLRALGLRGNQVMSVFLIKAAVVGLIGAVIGCGVGFVAGGLGVDIAANLREAAGIDAATVLGAIVLPAVAVLLLTPLLCAIASWLPATTAARQDPAEVLSQE
jgi:hypothetical protein